MRINENIQTPTIKDFTANGKLWTLKEPMKIEFMEWEATVNIETGEEVPFLEARPAGPWKKVYSMLYGMGEEEEEALRSLREMIGEVFEEMASMDVETRFANTVFIGGDEGKGEKERWETMKNELLSMVVV